MDSEIQPSKILKTIQVKGMNGLSLPYIQRFFGHAGPVQQVKKIQDLVVVRFKNQSSINKAFRFNGRVIDKQPIKIRGAAPSASLEQKQRTKLANIKQQNKQKDELDQIIKNRAFDVPFLWANILKIISKIRDDKTRWIMHQIFFLKLSQVIHFHAFATNPRSIFYQITLKDSLSGENKNNITLAESQEKIQKLQILSFVPNDLLDEANYECYRSSADLRLKLKFRQILKAVDGDRLYELYSLFNAYSLYIPQDESIFSVQSHLEFQGDYYLVSTEIITENRARISLQDKKDTKTRSQYRKIDTNHPSKEIEILSDSCLSQKYLQYTTYDIFRDNFDGNVTNNCAADLFFQNRFHFASNNIVIRYRESGKIHYFRLNFQLRLINCQDEIMGPLQFCEYLQYKSQSSYQIVNEIRLQKHNIVLSEFQNVEKSVYLIEAYIRFFIPSNFIKKEGEQSTVDNVQSPMCIFIIMPNPTQENLGLFQKLSQQMNKNQSFNKSGSQLYCLKIDDEDKFQKYKCCNFIQDYVDHQKGAFNEEIARMHAKKLIQQSPNKFQCISNAQQYVTQVIWKLEQQKSKREAKNRIKIQLHNARKKSNSLMNV